MHGWHCYIFKTYPPDKLSKLRTTGPCLYGGGLPGCPSYSPCLFEKKNCLYESELPGKHEAYALKWATTTRQITKLCKLIGMNLPKYSQTFAGADYLRRLDQVNRVGPLRIYIVCFFNILIIHGNRANPLCRDLSCCIPGQLG